MVNSWLITYSNKLLPINNHMFDHMTNHWYLDDQIRKILLLWYRKLQKHVPFLRVGNYSMPDFHFFSQRVFRRPFAELHLGGFQVEPKDLIDLRGQFPGGCDDGGPHHELQAAGAAAHALRQGAAHDLESGDQKGQGRPWARAGLAIRLIGPWWPWEKPLENTEIWGTNCWASCSDGILGTNFDKWSHIFLTKKMHLDISVTNKHSSPPPRHLFASATGGWWWLALASSAWSPSAQWSAVCPAATRGVRRPSHSMWYHEMIQFKSAQKALGNWPVKWGPECSRADLNKTQLRQGMHSTLLVHLWHL